MNYGEMYKTVVVKPVKLAEVKWVVGKILPNKERYEAIQVATGVPWWFVAITHFMEGGGKFNTHLHNGDPLTGRTTHVPAGRPKTGHPPFTWEESAIDAMKFMGYDKVSDWSVNNSLHLFEKYNGMGYSRRGVPSPYLWSYTQYYSKGKYAADGKYDPLLISKQPGAAAIMKQLGVGMVPGAV